MFKDIEKNDLLWVCFIYRKDEVGENYFVFFRRFCGGRGFLEVV